MAEGEEKLNENIIEKSITAESLGIVPQLQ